MSRDSQRRDLLRRELVRTVDETPVGARRRVSLGAIAAIAGFGLAGALTGGAVSAAFASGASDPDAPGRDPETVTIGAQAFAKSILGSHAQIFGAPFIVAGEGRMVIDLGERPEESTSLLMITSCVDAGTVDAAIDGEWWGTSHCDETGGGSGGFNVIPGDGEHRLTLVGSARYVVYAAWAADAPPPPMSAAQTAEMADGVVTEAEYHAAFDRFSACMTDAGYPLAGVGPAGPLINYSILGTAADAGVDTLCYVAEFEQVDMSWQLAHEDDSYSAQVLRDCLEAHGIPAPRKMADIVAAMEEAGISDADCAP